jgi:hypothetical protein
MSAIDRDQVVYALQRQVAELQRHADQLYRQRDYGAEFPAEDAERMREAITIVQASAQIEQERDRLHALLNTPETISFLEGTRREVAHQVERWGTVHDRAKEPADWFWLLGYLAGKALRAHAEADREKALHHCISSAAVLANWHSHILLGCSEMAPGSSDLQAFLRETFGANFVEATGPT